MTVAVTNASDGPFTGNGSTTVFPFTFKAMAAAEVAVYVDGLLTGSGFTITLGASAGGTVTFGTAPLAGKAIIISSAPSFQQNVALTNNGAFLPDVIEHAFDQAAIRDIALRRDLGQAIVAPVGQAPPTIASLLASVASTALATIQANPLTVTSATGQTVTTRTLLAGITSRVNGQVAMLIEAGKVGTFKFSTANLSTQVTADPTQGMYLAPADAPTGASGAWVRQYVGPVYASWFCALDSNLLSGGGTDDTAGMQAALNLASGGAPLWLVVNGPALVQNLKIYGGTTLQGANGGGFYAKNSTNKTMLRNANPAGSGAVTDKNINILGMTFNGNCANQTGVGVVATREADLNLIGMVQLFGVANVKVLGCKCINSKTIACYFSNATDVEVGGLVIDNNVVGQFQQGGVQFEGNSSRIFIHDIIGTTQDDMIGLSTGGASYVEPGTGTGIGPYVIDGPITDVQITNINGYGNTLSAVRLFCGTQLLDRVVIDGITGTFCTALLWSEPANLIPNIGTVSISNANVHMTNYTGVTPTQQGISLYGNIKHFIINNVNFNDPEDNRGHLYIDGTADVKQLSVNGLRVTDTAADHSPVTMLHVAPLARLRKASFRDIKWYRDPTFARALQMMYISTSAVVEELTFDGVYITRVNDGIRKDSAGTMTRLTARNIVHLGATSTGNAFISNNNASSTISLIDVSGWYSDMAGRVFNTPGGTITAKRGDAFRSTATATLVAGTVTVTYADAATTTKVFVNRHTDGGTVGASYSVTRNAGVGFTITAKDGSGATQAADTSTLDLVIQD